MKTKTLIKLLQNTDPSGELEVTTLSGDIYDASNLPAYYDGPLQVILPEGKAKFEESYSITGIEFRNTGRKVVLHTFNYEDIIWDATDDYPAIIKYENDRVRESMEPRVDKVKAELAEFMEKFEKY